MHKLKIKKEWFETPQPSLRLEVWVNKKYFLNVEKLILGYLREVENEFNLQIPKGLHKLMMEFGISDILSWDDPNLLEYLI